MNTIFNYDLAKAFCHNNPAHPALLTEEEFAKWCNGFIFALNTPAQKPAVAPVAPVAPVTPVAPAKKPIVIYTDGACSGNPGKGGYAAILVCGEHTKEVTGGCEFTTNNKMELSAVIAALEALRKKSDVVIRSDSNYVVNNFKFIETWRNNGWVKKDKTPVLNAELWQKLAELVATKCNTCTFEHVYGHAGNMLNEKCDKLAKLEIYKLDHAK